MKKILLVLFVMLLGILGTYYYVTLPMVKVADGFFHSIKENNISKAEQYLSEGFKKNTSIQELSQYLVRYGMNDYQSLRWGYKRVIDINKGGKSGHLEGVMTSKDGVRSPIKVLFKKEHGSWKLFALEKVLSKKEIAQQKLLGEYTKLARISMHYLGKAVSDNNMTILYQNISKFWQKETSVKALKKTYGVFIEKKVNLLALDKLSPKLTGVGVSKKEILTLSGYYSLGKNALYFTQKFIPEKNVWKLVGLSVQIK